MYVEKKHKSNGDTPKTVNAFDVFLAKSMSTELSGLIKDKRFDKNSQPEAERLSSKLNSSVERFESTRKKAAEAIGKRDDALLKLFDAEEETIKFVISTLGKNYANLKKDSLKEAIKSVEDRRADLIGASRRDETTALLKKKEPGIDQKYVQ
jgi:hypothetical protein